MTSRGYVTVTVTNGDPAALRVVLDQYLDADNDDPGEMPGTIFLDEVSWLDTAAMMAADPEAIWYSN